MWYSPTVTVAATSEPLTIAEAKAQCRVDGTDDDATLTGYIAAARAYVEGYCGTPLTERTVTVKCDGFCDFAQFPVVPLRSVSSVSYVDGDGATQTLATSVYDVRSDGLTAALVLKSGQTWPTIQSASRITVTASVGYAALPDGVKHALLLLIAQWFDNRSATNVGNIVNELPHAVPSLLANHRIFSF